MSSEVFKPKQASAITRAKNSPPTDRLFDPQDLERVRSGFIASRTEPTITDTQGRKVVFTLQGGRKITVEATGRWAQRYSAIANRADNVLGGGLSEMQVRTSDGATGTAIFEITGQFHHKYFPIARGANFPPDGA